MYYWGIEGEISWAKGQNILVKGQEKYNQKK
jgi:hypothetical protein